MYTRKVTDFPGSLIKARRPVFGTFKGHPARLDIRGIYKPYGIIPLPVSVTNLCIRSRLLFSFNAGDYMGRVNFIDTKIVGYTEVILWNTKSNLRFAYRSLTPFRKRFVPHDLGDAVTSNYIKRRYTRVGWDKEQNRLYVLIRLKGDASRPSVRAWFTADYGGGDFAELTCSRPYPTMRRVHAAYSCAADVYGGVSLTFKDGETFTQDNMNGVYTFNISRSYLQFHSYGDTVLLLGSCNDATLAVKLSSDPREAVDSDTYNSNVAFYKGKATPLPPVVISHYTGIEKQWVIQDTESMVDLTFTPVSVSANNINTFIIRSLYSTIYGTIDGFVVVNTPDGGTEKLTLKAFPALSENYLIRL